MEPEKIYYCPECGTIITAEAIADEIASGGYGMCMCEFGNGARVLVAYLPIENRTMKLTVSGDLIVNEKFMSHSGEILPYKIECDTLTDGDIDTIAGIIASNTTFGSVIGVPTGGLRLQYALGKYLGWGEKTLIVDDVLTTGTSMEEMKKATIEDHNGWIFDEDIVGWVIFARGKLPDWINAVFTVTESTDL